MVTVVNSGYILKNLSLGLMKIWMKSVKKKKGIKVTLVFLAFILIEGSFVYRVRLGWDQGF